jgi:hypothetical protein
MKKVLMLIMIFIISVTFVDAEYISNIDYCSMNSDGVIFTADCPHDHRIDGNWLRVKHYLNATSESKCINGNLIQEGCEFEILLWNHPNVVGLSNAERKSKAITSDNTIPDEIPEFGSIGVSLALIGAVLVYKKSMNKI